jgi:tetratricopeptide (TPR) repeat protein/CHAT domain-containing protein
MISLSLLATGGFARVVSAQPAKEPGNGPLSQQHRAALADQSQKLSGEAQYLVAQGRFDEALDRAQRALAIRERLYPPDQFPRGHHDLAVAISDLGVVLQYLGQWDQARAHYERALELFRKLYPPGEFQAGPADLATCQCNLGVMLTRQGEHELARKHLDEALALRRRLHAAQPTPQTQFALAESLNNLGFLFRALGQFREAQTHFEETVAILKELAGGADDPNLATCLCNLGQVLEAQAQYEAAHTWLQEALAMRRRLFPPERFPQGHPALAESLNSLAFLCHSQGDFVTSQRYYEAGLGILRQQFPPGQFPGGHPDLAQALSSCGALLQAQGDYALAQQYFEEALQMRHKLFPPARYPQGHFDLMTSLADLGGLHHERNDLPRSRTYKEQALEMARRLYPPERFPRGHPALASCLNNLATLLSHQGEHAQARAYAEESAAIDRKLFPKEEYPHGHPYLAVGLSNVAAILQQLGNYDLAEQRFEEALRMRREAFPGQLHPEVAASLNHLALLKAAQQDHAAAIDYARQALEMRRGIYPPETYPLGHSQLLISTSNLAHVLNAAGQNAEALKLLKNAVDMARRLYPPEVYPYGHRQLAVAENNLGFTLLDCGRRPEAQAALTRALDMFLREIETLAGAASEVEALNLLAALPGTLDGLLSATHDRPEETAAEVYARVWQRRGAIGRIVARRQQAVLSLPAGKPRQVFEELQQTRRNLARLMFAPADADPQRLAARRKTLADLSQRKEKLERSLAAELPTWQATALAQPPRHTELLQKLPQHVAVVDLLHYVWFQPVGAPAKPTRSYAAFVLLHSPRTDRAASGPGTPAESTAPPAKQDGSCLRVELGPAEPIEAAIAAWRDQIARDKPESAAAKLRELVWAPIEQALTAASRPLTGASPPSGPNPAAGPPRAATHQQPITTIYLCPDGALAALPWCALPGGAPGSVLLEEYELAVLPHAAWLVEQLRPAVPPAKPGTMLLVGDVAYDKPPQVPRLAGLAKIPFLSVDRGPNQKSLPPLPGTKIELDALVEIKRPGDKVTRLDGSAASASRLIAELPQARTVHLATHGFFLVPGASAAIRLPAADFEQRDFLIAGERTTATGRNPLVLSGLALAGADLPPPLDEFGIPQGDVGLLTAEVISGLDLRGLELAVLSACESGLGDVAGGEGVYGLQRAFHTAGCRNVVASLWTVSDTATLALMKLFYYNLWKRNLPPLAALRSAQLYLYRHPAEIARLAGLPADKLGRETLRGIDVSPGPKPGTSSTRRANAAAKARTSHWAAFVLSGVGK